MFKGIYKESDENEKINDEKKKKKQMKKINIV